MKQLRTGVSKNGIGIFTQQDIISGEEVFEVKGTFLSCDADDDLDERTRANTFRFDEEKYLSPEGEIGDFLNHSCEPNSYVVKKANKLFIVAIKDVASGEEITIDYSTIIAPDDFWEMQCNCGARNCRGRIGQFKDLPEKKKEEYILAGMVPKYILSL